MVFEREFMAKVSGWKIDKELVEEEEEEEER